MGKFLKMKEVEATIQYNKGKVKLNQRKKFHHLHLK
jgi:hypothetical protein